MNGHPRANTLSDAPSAKHLIGINQNLTRGKVMVNPNRYKIAWQNYQQALQALRKAKCPLLTYKTHIMLMQIILAQINMKEEG